MCTCTGGGWPNSTTGSSGSRYGWEHILALLWYKTIQRRGQETEEKEDGNEDATPAKTGKRKGKDVATSTGRKKAQGTTPTSQRGRNKQDNATPTGSKGRRSARSKKIREDVEDEEVSNDGKNDNEESDSEEKADCEHGDQQATEEEDEDIR